MMPIGGSWGQNPISGQSAADYTWTEQNDVVNIPTPQPPYSGPGAPDQWDFWRDLEDILADYDPDQLARIREYVMTTGRWRVPKNARDIMSLAKLAKQLQDDESAAQLAMQAIYMGFQRPKWNLMSIFGPELQRWGLSWGTPTSGRSSRSASERDLAGLAALFG